jgi:hypothetical protein
MAILIDAPPSPVYLAKRTPKGKRRWGKGLTQTLSAAVDVRCADRVAALAEARGMSRCELLRRVYRTIDENGLWDVLTDGKTIRIFHQSVASVFPQETSQRK